MYVTWMTPWKLAVYAQDLFGISICHSGSGEAWCMHWCIAKPRRLECMCVWVLLCLCQSFCMLDFQDMVFRRLVLCWQVLLACVGCSAVSVKSMQNWKLGVYHCTQVLLMRWNTSFPWDQPPYHFLDMFAGDANASRMWPWPKHHVNAQYDVFKLTYVLIFLLQETSALQLCSLWFGLWFGSWEVPESWEKNAFVSIVMYDCVHRSRAQDFNTPPGFLCGPYMLKCLDMYWYLLKARCFNELMCSFPRTALFGCLMLHPGCMSLWGPDCRSWSIASRATSMRSIVSGAMGVGYDFVIQGNLMVSRLGSVLWSCMQSILCLTHVCSLFVLKHDCPGWSFAFFVF